ncbi:unnamed protein product [Allacma fusca]|uniref:LITAF domain-containing protein n=1 Tax=Allacma fusca TaxID=39272 RepID=A0A8J2K9D0_9HEXA|nr:unnamed protein product [Allacma fusca]
MTSWDVVSIASGERKGNSLTEEEKDDCSIRSVSYIDRENTPESSFEPSYEPSEDGTRIPTPKNTGSVLPISGPGLLIKPEQKPVSFCPRCGFKIDAADTKMIPKQKVWFIFLVLFLCCCWWISWLPFLFKSCSKPVEICPYCYRRTDRPQVGSDNKLTAGINTENP